jgi:uncharacterized membrane protein SpoIIM required for sporulation
MLELLLNPKKAEKRSWQMFFIGFFYSVLAVIVSHLIFGQAESKYIGIWIVTFTVILSMPFAYFLFKLEERRDLEYEGAFKVLFEHRKALAALTWLFIGFLIGYTLCYMFFSKNYFLPQIETFCSINRASNYEACVSQYTGQTSISGFSTSTGRFLGIFTNNMQVLILTFVFSIIFGAGGIFVLAWNATVIASAIGIYIKSQLNLLPLGLARYMIHGIPEIAAYLLAALAGGIISMLVLNKDYKDEKFMDILQDVLNLIILAIIILVIAGGIEVFITPKLFSAS